MHLFIFIYELKKITYLHPVQKKNKVNRLVLIKIQSILLNVKHTQYGAPLSQVLCSLTLELCISQRQIGRYDICGLLFTPDLSTVLSVRAVQLLCIDCVYDCMLLFVYRNCLWLADSFISALGSGYIGFPHCVHVCFPLRFLERTSSFLVTYSDNFFFFNFCTENLCFYTDLLGKEKIIVWSQAYFIHTGF